MKTHLSSRLIQLKGFTLVDLMISVLIGSLLLTGVAQLLGISRQIFQQVSGTSDLYNNGLSAIQYLRMNVKYAGRGITYPVQAPDPTSQLTANTTVLNLCCNPNATAGTGVMAAIPGWVYIGYYYDCGQGGAGALWSFGKPDKPTSNQTPKPMPVGPNVNPFSCALATETFNLDATKPDNERYYANVACNCQCRSSDPGYIQDELLNRLVPFYKITAPATLNPAPGASSKIIPAKSDDATDTCTGDSTLNCGGHCRQSVYQRLIPHVHVAPNANTAYGDELSIIFAVRNGYNNVTDCRGTIVNPSNPSNPPDGAATTQPVLLQNKFKVAISATTNLPTLQCQSTLQTNGVWASPSGWTDIISNVEVLKVMVGVNDNVSTQTVTVNNLPVPINNVNRYVPAPFPATQLYNGKVTASTLDINKVISIRLALVVRSADKVLPQPASTTLTLFPATTIAPLTAVTSTPTTPDQYQRKVFTTTIFLEAFNQPSYVPHCVKGSNQFYIKTAGIPWVDGATSSDQCCGDPSGTCYYYNSFSDCETDRYWKTGGLINTNCYTQGTPQ